MFAIEHAVGAVAVAGTAFRKSFFLSPIVTEHAWEARPPRLITIGSRSWGCLRSLSFWLPIIQVRDFLHGNGYRSEVEHYRSRPATPGTR